jgi:hypothetical protein
MNARTAQRILTTALCALAPTALAAAPAGAEPVKTGCPHGYLLLAVADLAPQGYRVPGQVDDPASGITSFGQPGNGDGLVCAKALGPQVTTWGGQLYEFWDNTSPA